MFREKHSQMCVGVLVTVAALAMGACARHDHGAHHARVYGSIKDESAPPKRSERRLVKKVASHATSTVASAKPRILPALKAPPPVERAAPVNVEKPQTASTAPAGPPQPTAEQPIPPVQDAAGVATLLAEGQALFEAGQVVQARRRFVAAMNGPIPDVLLALARSYDTYYLSRLPSSDAAPDMQRALVLYERALARGAKEAEPDLERTRNVLKVPR